MSSLLADLEDADGQSRLTALAAFKTTFEAADSQAALVLQQDAFPHLLRVLKETEVSLSSLSIENQVRASALETIQRFTFSEAFKAALPNLLRTILEILQSDNEENACIVLKMFIDIHKAYKTGLEDFVQPFLDIVLKTYQNMPAAVRESFDSVPSASGTSRLIQPTTSDTPMSPSASNDAIENTHPPDKLLSRSTKSFKVLTELPIIIVLLFSSNRQIVQTNLVQFTSVIVEMLSLQPPASNESQKSATISSPIRRQMFADLMLAQIKTLSFLAYVLRGYTAYMKKYAESIPQFVLRLLRDCPSEMSAARKVHESSTTLFHIAYSHRNYWLPLVIFCRRNLGTLLSITSKYYSTRNFWWESVSQHARPSGQPSRTMSSLWLMILDHWHTACWPILSIMYVRN